MDRADDVGRWRRHHGGPTQRAPPGQLAGDGSGEGDNGHGCILRRQRNQLHRAAHGVIDHDTSAGNDTSTSFTDLDTVGPTATVTSGNRVLMVLKCVLSNNTVNALSAMGVSSSGAHTVSASDIYSLRHTSSTANAQVAASFVHIFGVTPGTSTWTAQYKVTSGTGNFDARMMSIVPF
jgi:hypothetical protein